jgi:hypothetical protein
MPVVPNNDDYYAQVPATNGNEDSAAKTGALKLKIKAKKVVEASDTVAPVVSSVSTPEKILEDKKPAFKPTISFEAAPKIEIPVRPATPAAFKPNTRTDTRSSSKSGAHPDEFYSSAPRTPSAPRASGSGEQKRSGFPFDPNKNFKVRTAQSPRISFAPAPTRSAAAPAPATAPNPGAPNKLQAYAKSHQDAPKRGRNAGGPKGTPDYTKPKKGFKTVGAT